MMLRRSLRLAALLVALGYDGILSALRLLWYRMMLAPGRLIPTLNGTKCTHSPLRQQHLEASLPILVAGALCVMDVVVGCGCGCGVVVVVG